MGFKDDLNEVKKDIKEHIDLRLTPITNQIKQADNERTTLFKLYKEQSEKSSEMDKEISKNKTMLSVVASVTSLVAGAFFAWVFGLFTKGES